MKFIVYSDIHKYAPQFTGHTVDQMIEENNYLKMVNPEVEVILTGDIIDVKNCKRWKEVDDSRFDIKRLEFIFGDRYLLGNHEVRRPDNYVYIKNGILFTHGHIIFWDSDKIDEWENKKSGQGKRGYYRYRVYKMFKIRKNKKLHPSKKHLQVIKELLIYYDCHTIVFGHSHRNYDVQYDWGRVVNVGQGRTELEL